MAAVAAPAVVVAAAAVDEWCLHLGKKWMLVMATLLKQQLVLKPH